MPAKITVACDGIVCDNKVEFDAPDWFGEFESEGGKRWFYCPDCKLQLDFFGAQCPGCVEGFSDCSLGKAFLYSYWRTITPDKLEAIEKGICPYRTNGTFSFSPKTGMERIDLSEIAPSPAGKAVAEAIREYIRKYPS